MAEYHSKCLGALCHEPDKQVNQNKTGDFRQLFCVMRIRWSIDFGDFNPPSKDLKGVPVSHVGWDCIF